MSDIFDDFKKVFKKDFVPVLIQYFNDPDNKITDNLNDLLNNPQTFLKGIFEKFSKKNDYNYNQESYTDVENLTNIDTTIDDEYNDLFKRLILIEENMVQIENIIKDKN